MTYTRMHFGFDSCRLGSCFTPIKNPVFLRGLLSKIGIDILSRALGQVPSAQAGLTSLFGMGRGDPRRNIQYVCLGE